MPCNGFQTPESKKDQGIAEDPYRFNPWSSEVYRPVWLCTECSQTIPLLAKSVLHSGAIPVKIG